MLSRKNLFTLFAMLAGFCITAEYAITKPVSHSLFIERYGAEYFPYAYLAVVPVGALLVSLYNRFVFRIGCIKMLLITVTLSASINLFMIRFQAVYYAMPFAFYLWKDVYVLLLFQQLWSVIHSTIDGSRSKHLYGLLHGVGGLGAVAGSLIPGFFAVKMGSVQLLLLTLPLIFFLSSFYFGLVKTSSGELKVKEKTPGGLKLLAGSRYLKFILLLVVCMQVSTTLAEYQFSTHVQRVFPDTDVRTAFLGKLFSIINSINVFWQFVGSFLLVHYMGLRTAHFLVPLVLILNGFGLIFFPHFRMMTYSYGALKSFDYSLFSILKEMLYVPLGTQEKFQAKSIIDVFAYRSSKALASLLVLALPALFIPWAMILIFFVWIVATLSVKHSKEIPSYGR